MLCLFNYNHDLKKTVYKVIYVDYLHECYYRYTTPGIPSVLQKKTIVFLSSFLLCQYLILMYNISIYFILKIIWQHIKLHFSYRSEIENSHI